MSRKFGAFTRTAAWTALALVLSAGAASAQETIRIGGSAGGTLQSGDSTLNSGEYVDVFTFEGQAGQQVTISMTSSAFDAYVMVRGPAGFAEENDDRESGDTNAQLTVRLPTSGTYRIQATSYEPGETGAYRVALQAGAGNTPTAEGGGAIELGQALNGQLSGGDTQIDSGEYVDGWTLTGRPGARYVARLNSTDFDPYLMVRGTDLSEDNDDDETGRGSRNSRLEFTMPDDGEVMVVATSYQPGETGAYTLRLDEVDGGGGSTPIMSGSSGSIRLGQSVSGRLADGDQTLRSGEYTEVYTLSGRAGDEVDLRLTSSEFDPYIFINGPDGFAEANDDDPTGETGTNSRLVVTLPADGDYQVFATSYQPGESGAFSLTANRASAGAVQTAQTSTSSSARSFAVGADIRGSLGPGDGQLDSGEYVDRFTFTGRRGERISLTLESTNFDAYLLFRGPNGQSEDNDDGPDGTNSRIDTVLQADGEYTVSLTSYQAGETGSYRFIAGESLGTPRQAGVQAGPRVFAVMVGISDYGGSGDLPYTADDALKLAEALRREGVLNPASIVLTDAQATVAGVKSAFARVAAQAGPDDIFLFFYSGHGSQRPSQVSAMEPDGKTETIVMRDGQISDAEMAQMFAGLDVRMAMIVLDSCFSGGFGRNVVSRPGVVGLFSSEEDLTSAVAGKFEAGGYLSHFLRTALTGEANLDGDDIITAGELTTYLRRKFATEVQDVGAQTMDGQRSYQNLVVERGGVQVDDVVLRLN